MTALTLTIILIYLVAIEKDDHRKIKTRKQMQYEENIGCYIFD